MLSTVCQPKHLSAKHRHYDPFKERLKMKLAVDCAKEKNVNGKI